MTSSPGEVPTGGACYADHCITCSDEALPMRVESIDLELGLASCVDSSGARSDVMIGLVMGVQSGDIVMVHAATALARVDASKGDAGNTK